MFGRLGNALSRTSDNFVLFHSSHSKAGQVIFSFLVKAWHFCSFPTQQLAAGLVAAINYAFDHLQCQYHQKRRLRMKDTCILLSVQSIHLNLCSIGCQNQLLQTFTS